MKGIAAAAEAYGAPFVSGKDSFYNYFETDEGPVSIPTTILISGMGVVESIDHVRGSSIRRDDSILAVVGTTTSELGGSVFARQSDLENAEVPPTDFASAMEIYRRFHKAAESGLILSGHDVSEGGLAVTLAEMGFSGKAGVEVDLAALPTNGEMDKASMLFGESPSRLVLEIAPENLEKVADLFEGVPFGAIGRTTTDTDVLRIEWGKEMLVTESLSDLKAIWKNGLAQYY